MKHNGTVLVTCSDKAGARLLPENTAGQPTFQISCLPGSF